MSEGDLGHKMENLQPPYVVSYLMKGAAAPHSKGLSEQFRQILVALGGTPALPYSLMRKPCAAQRSSPLQLGDEVG